MGAMYTAFEAASRDALHISVGAVVRLGAPGASTAQGDRGAGPGAGDRPDAGGAAAQ